MIPPNLTYLEDRLYIVEAKTGHPKYDFDFSSYFSCAHPTWLDHPIQAVARMGAAPNYEARFRELQGYGVTLIHTPEQYARASLLPQWYPRLEGLTPESLWFDEPPRPEQIEALLDYPLFLKGERQTNRHNRRQSIIEGPEQLREVLAQWAHDPILGWQRVVARRFVELRPVAEDLGAGLPRVFEFRTFWWRGACVGIGPYWSAPRYELDGQARDAVIELGGEVCRRIEVPFLVVDVAQTRQGAWIVIECNDGQDSGYMGVDRLQMWRRVLDIEEARGPGTHASGHQG